jgi:hypothetical protein
VAAVGDVDVEVCVVDGCEATVTVDAASGRAADFHTLTAIERQRVELTVRASQRGRVLAVGTRTVRLERLAPNGVACGPVCYRGRLTLGPEGLSAVSATTGP